MPIKTVNCETLKKWLNNNEAFVVDVREPEEHAAEKIAGSKLVPLNTVSKDSIADCCGKKLVIHCRSGKRSAAACQKLIAENPDLEVYDLEGGIMAWSSQKNNNTTKSNKPSFFANLFKCCK